MRSVRLIPRKAPESITFPQRGNPTFSFFLLFSWKTYKNVSQLNHLEIYQAISSSFCSPVFHQGTTQAAYLAMTLALQQQWHQCHFSIKNKKQKLQSFAPGQRFLSQVKKAKIAMEMGLWKGDPVLPYSKRHLTSGSPWVWRYRELLRNDSQS